MSPLRPDLIDCWVFRVPEREIPPGAEPAIEVLLVRRAPGRILPGLWQCVSGSVEADERVALAAVREVREETGYAPEAMEAFYDLDLVNQFHEPSVDGVMLSAVFAARVRNGLEPVLSHEHTAFRWLPLQDAWREVVWPGYRDALGRIRDNLLDPEREPWFRLDPVSGGRILDA